MATNYPLAKFHFEVDYNGSQIGFTEVTGLDITRDLIEYRDGANPEFSKRKMPGLHKFNNITLKRGVFKGENEFYTWFYNNINQNSEDMQRITFTIKLLDEEHNPVVSWQVKNAWVLKFTSPDLKADGNEVAIESIEIAHESLTVINPAS
jgi:phage tail-like protein